MMALVAFVAALDGLMRLLRPQKLRGIEFLAWWWLSQSRMMHECSRWHLEMMAAAAFKPRFRFMARASKMASWMAFADAHFSGFGWVAKLNCASPNETEIGTSLGNCLMRQAELWFGLPALAHWKAGSEFLPSLWRKNFRVKHSLYILSDDM